MGKATKISCVFLVINGGIGVYRFSLNAVNIPIGSKPCGFMSILINLTVAISLGLVVRIKLFYILNNNLKKKSKV